ncbi:MAG: hypothetical protein AVDCRST_MAG02-2776, partial [uncultured Rubrobacteraceae bacterium]
AGAGPRVRQGRRRPRAPGRRGPEDPGRGREAARAGHRQRGRRRARSGAQRGGRRATQGGRCRAIPGESGRPEPRGWRRGCGRTDRRRGRPRPGPRILPI